MNQLLMAKRKLTLNKISAAIKKNCKDEELLNTAQKFKIFANDAIMLEKIDCNTINELRTVLLKHLDETEIPSSQKIAITYLPILSLYWPLDDKCVLTGETLTDQNTIPTTSGYLVSKGALSKFFKEKNYVNPATQKPFAKIDLTNLLHVAEKNGLVAKNARYISAGISGLLGIGLNILIVNAFGSMLFELIVGLIALNIVYLYILFAVYVLSLILTSLACAKIGAALDQALLVVPLILTIGLPTICMAIIGYLLGGMINQFNHRPAFIEASPNKLSNQLIDNINNEVTKSLTSSTPTDDEATSTQPDPSIKNSSYRANGSLTFFDPLQKRDHDDVEVEVEDTLTESSTAEVNTSNR